MLASGVQQTLQFAGHQHINDKEKQMSSLMIIRSLDEPVVGDKEAFQVAICEFETVAEVQKYLDDAGSTHEKAVTIIPLDEQNDAIRAIAAILNLSVNLRTWSDDGLSAEELFLQVFMAGRESVTKHNNPEGVDHGKKSQAPRCGLSLSLSA